MNKNRIDGYMVQYGLWPNCSNNCDFCLLKERDYLTKSQQLYWIKSVKENIDHIDWKGKFFRGISILGGELFFIKDKQLQDALLDLVNDIIDKILIPNYPRARFSFVSNGLYDPEFLFQVCDLVRDRVGAECLDVNFSYDLKHRFKTEKAREIVRNNINAFSTRYNYKVGVQMILTQHVINLWKQGQFDVNKFMADNFVNGNLCFLYPHPVRTGKVLDDFYFKRRDFLNFLAYLKVENYRVYHDFINSCKNSGIFKYTGLDSRDYNHSPTEQPILSDGKEVLQSECGHSTLYNCYEDSDRCLLCDLLALDENLVG